MSDNNTETQNPENSQSATNESITGSDGSKVWLSITLQPAVQKLWQDTSQMLWAPIPLNLLRQSHILLMIWIGEMRIAGSAVSMLIRPLGRWS